jgi:hypothetical protein
MTLQDPTSRLEWSVIRLARVDSLATLREPGRWGRFVNWLMGRNGTPNWPMSGWKRCGVAVLSWHYGFVPGEDVASFFSADSVQPMS